MQPCNFRARRQSRHSGDKATPEPASTELLPPVIKRVLFLGDSITYSGQYTAYVEAYFATRFSTRRITFINAGLPSETVSGLSEPNHADGQFPRPVLRERLARLLEKIKPDLILACYGMNDGLYMSFDCGRFKLFCEGMEQLHNVVTANGTKIIHLTPPYFDGVKNNNPAYVETMARYSKWLVVQHALGWNVIDINGSMTNYIVERRKTQSNFVFAADGIHPDDFGHWMIAKAILLGLGAFDVKDMTDVKQMVSVISNSEKILALIKQREELMRDAWLAEIGHNRPGILRGLPLVEANTEAMKIGTLIEALQSKATG